MVSGGVWEVSWGCLGGQVVFAWFVVVSGCSLAGNGWCLGVSCGVSGGVWGVSGWAFGGV